MAQLSTKERDGTEAAAARAGLVEFWNTWKKTAPELSDEEAEALVGEAVAFARGRL